MNALLWSAAKPVACMAALAAVAIVATRPGTRRALWSLRARLTAWDGTSDDAITPAGGDIADEPDAVVEPEDQAIADLLAELAGEVRAGCDCPACDQIRAWAVDLLRQVTADDREMLANLGITWDEVAS